MTAMILGYGRFDPEDVQKTSYALMAYSWGLLGFSLVKVLVPGYYARQDTKRPVRIALTALGVTTLLNVLVVIPASRMGFRKSAHPHRHVHLHWRGLQYAAAVARPGEGRRAEAVAGTGRSCCCACWSRTSPWARCCCGWPVTRWCGRRCPSSSASCAAAAGIAPRRRGVLCSAVRAGPALSRPARGAALMRLQRRLEAAGSGSTRLRGHDWRIRRHSSRAIAS